MNGIQAVITQENAKITCNFKQVEKAIQDKLAEYEGIVFTEDSKASARKEVASLRAEKKSLQDNMRDAKTQYMKPWENFEAQAKKLIGLYDEPIDLINGQIQAFEKSALQKRNSLFRKFINVFQKICRYIFLWSVSTIQSGKTLHIRKKI